MIAIRVLVFAVGVGLTGWIVLSAIRTTVLPRSAQVAISRLVFTSSRRLFALRLRRSNDFAVRDRIMALYGPTSLLALPVVWLALIWLAYALMFWALDTSSFTAALGLSGSSLTTLGFVAAESFWEQLVAFTEAGWGLILVALLITFLPSIYSTFSRREAQVAMLEVRAGDPPSAVGMLLRHHRIGWLEDIDNTWLDWERWFAELEESHTTFPILVFFRSPQPQRSWVTASGTVLDAASLYASCVQTARIGPVGVCIRSGFLALRSLANSFGIEFDPDPRPDDPISISRQEFDEAWDLMQEAGMPLRTDQDQAWRDFAGWRVNYDTVLLSLAEITMAPYATWTSDRSSPSHQRPQVRRFGMRVRNGGKRRVSGKSS
ncbi:MAG: hypothetical protein QNJ77_08600 [Acidimicrobiia bacterium]|nr:hypothetical protein [Acidimicrobiia bacterium]